MNVDKVELFLKHKKLLLRIANKYSNRYAEDLVQDFFIKWATSKTEVNDMNNPKAYIARSMFNYCINFIKRKSVYNLFYEYNTPLVIDDPNETEEDLLLKLIAPDNPEKAAHRNSCLRAAMQRLTDFGVSEKQKNVIRTVIETGSHEHAAELLGSNTNLIKVTCHKYKPYLTGIDFE